jgi:DNA-directed RNA polymerase subunit omega
MYEVACGKYWPVFPRPCHGTCDQIFARRWFAGATGSERQLNDCDRQAGGGMELLGGFDSNYRFILVAAKRARQLQSGAKPMVDTSSRKSCRVAQDEIMAGKVKWIVPDTKSAVDTARELLDKAIPENNS